MARIVQKFGGSSVADAEKFIVANPSGAIPLAQQNPPLPDGCWAWNVPGVPTTSGQFPPADARRKTRTVPSGAKRGEVSRKPRVSRRRPPSSVISHSWPT